MQLKKKQLYSFIISIQNAWALKQKRTCHMITTEKIMITNRDVFIVFSVTDLYLIEDTIDTWQHIM